LKGYQKGGPISEERGRGERLKQQHLRRRVGQSMASYNILALGVQVPACRKVKRGKGKEFQNPWRDTAS